MVKFLDELYRTTNLQINIGNLLKSSIFFPNSSETVGCGKIFGTWWSYFYWLEAWNVAIRNDITLLEFVLLVL